MAKKSKDTRGLILKTWQRCRSIGRGSKELSDVHHFATNSKPISWPSSPVSPYREDKGHKRCRVAPHGCLSIYVGPQKQRFVIKTDCLNHPLFKILLDEAESEYGYNSEGPLMLPCDVDIFCKVLAEMDGDDIHHGCNFARSYSSYSLLSPSRLVSADRVY